MAQKKPEGNLLKTLTEGENTRQSRLSHKNPKKSCGLRIIPKEADGPIRLTSEDAEVPSAMYCYG